MKYHGCRATKDPRRCASATRRPGRFNSTSTARCSTHSTSPAKPASRRKKRGWALECALVAHLETIWEQPDDGIWEVRGGRRHFTHSKVMAWVAFDRIVRSAEEFQLEGPLDRWRAVRDTIHRQVCDRGFDPTQNSFVQSYGATAVDASLLMIAMVGFLPAEDPRVRGTVAAIERDLLRDGFVLRYDTGNRNRRPSSR